MTAAKKTTAARAVAEFSDFSLKMTRGQRMLQRLKDEDVQIATADKEVVFRRDKVTLYRYKATAKRTVDVPVLVAYGQIGRYTMTDLQEDRSMLRNLLALGVDVYAVDWGNPSRSDRWLTFEDYVDDYLNECVEFICREQSIPSINLLGICEGGVFSLCYAALYPHRVKNLVLTITPVDFHQDQAEGRKAHGLLNLWTRGLGADDIDQLIEANGNLPGELMSYVFAQMTPGATLSKYNIGLLGHVRRRKEAAELPADGEVDRGSSASSGRSSEAAAREPLQEQRAHPRRVSSSQAARSICARSRYPCSTSSPRRITSSRRRPRRPWARRSEPRTTRRSASRADTSACSSAASRKAFSAREYTTGYGSGIDAFDAAADQAGFGSGSRRIQETLLCGVGLSEGGANGRLRSRRFENRAGLRHACRRAGRTGCAGCGTRSSRSRRQ